MEQELLSRRDCLFVAHNKVSFCALRHVVRSTSGPQRLEHGKNPVSPAFPVRLGGQLCPEHTRRGACSAQVPEGREGCHPTPRLVAGSCALAGGAVLRGDRGRWEGASTPAPTCPGCLPTPRAVPVAPAHPWDPCPPRLSSGAYPTSPFGPVVPGPEVSYLPGLPPPTRLFSLPRAEGQSSGN